MTKRRLERARKMIIDFSEKNRGKDIVVANLNDKDLYSFILADTYFGIDALLGYDADVSLVLTRAIEKADQHKKDKFVTYRAENKNKITQLV